MYITASLVNKQLQKEIFETEMSFSVQFSQLQAGHTYFGSQTISISKCWTAVAENGWKSAYSKGHHGINAQSRPKGLT